MLRRLLAGVAFIALATASALAADIPPSTYHPPVRYIPPPRAPALVPFFSWSGFYLGINAGYGWGKSSWTNTVTNITTGDFDISGALVGGTIGYNFQVGGAVLGLEADFDWSNITGSSTTFCAAGCQTSANWLGTGRARLGYSLDRFLPYVTGGVAYGNVKASTPGLAFSATNIGWTAGGGMEYAFVNNWTMKAEYLYVDLGNVTCDATCSGASPIKVTFTSHIVRGGLNFKF